MMAALPFFRFFRRNFKLRGNFRRCNFKLLDNLGENSYTEHRKYVSKVASIAGGHLYEHAGSFH